MKPWIRLTLIGVIAAIVGHGAVILDAPYVLMSAAMAKISRQGTRVNVWIHPPRTTEASRTVVRPSPDLAYSSCIYDLSRGPIRVTAAPWDDYMSVSIFAASSDNIFAINDRQAPRGVDLTLVKDGDTVAAPSGSTLVRSPSTRGIILQRRLAPTAARFAIAAAARAHDICATIAS